MMMYNRGFVGNGGFYGHTMMGGWGILILIGIVLIIVAVVLVLRKGRKTESAENEALSVLKLKFVNGEITEEEYISKKNILERK